MQYEVVEESNRLRFVSLVKQYIEKGWEPVGGVSICRLTDGWCYYAQAMVKK